MRRCVVAGLQVLLALTFDASGAQKLVGTLVKMREHLGVTPPRAARGPCLDRTIEKPSRYKDLAPLIGGR